MAGGQKHWRKRTIQGESELDGIALQWELISEPSWSNSGDGYKGLCILVRVASDARRELIIEYPFPTGKDGRKLPGPAAACSVGQEGRGFYPGGSSSRLGSELKGPNLRLPGSGIQRLRPAKAPSPCDIPASNIGWPRARW